MNDTVDSAELQKLAAYAAFQACETAVLAGATDMRPEMEQAKADYLATVIPGNANPYVPWSDPDIPFHCECDEIIYADTEHLHEPASDAEEQG